MNNQPLNHVAVIGALRGTPTDRSSSLSSSSGTASPRRPRGVANPPAFAQRCKSDVSLSSRSDSPVGGHRRTAAAKVQQQRRPRSGPSSPTRTKFMPQSGFRGGPIVVDHRGAPAPAFAPFAQPYAKPRLSPSSSASSATFATPMSPSSVSTSSAQTLASQAQAQRERDAAAERDELDVVRQTRDILEVASEHALKAVDLANALRNRVGVDVLGRVREAHGGLLSLLERHRDVVRVRRVPKHDIVSLAPTAAEALRAREQQQQQGLPSSGSSTSLNFSSDLSGNAGEYVPQDPYQQGGTEAAFAAAQTYRDLIGGAQQQNSVPALDRARPRDPTTGHLFTVAPGRQRTYDDDTMTEPAPIRRHTFDEVVGNPMDSSLKGTKKPPSESDDSEDDDRFIDDASKTLFNGNPSASTSSEEFDAVSSFVHEGPSPSHFRRVSSSGDVADAFPPPAVAALWGSVCSSQSEETPRQNRSERSYSSSSDPFFSATQDVPSRSVSETDVLAFGPSRPYLPEAKVVPTSRMLLNQQQQQKRAPVLWDPPRTTAPQEKALSRAPTPPRQSPPTPLTVPWGGSVAAATAFGTTPQTFAAPQFLGGNGGEQSFVSGLGGVTQQQAPAPAPPQDPAPQQQQQQQQGTRLSPPPLLNVGSQRQLVESAARSRRALERLMSEDYVPTQRWPRSSADDAPLVATVLESLDHLRGCATLNKLRSALKQRHNLPRSVKSVPLRAFLASYADLFVLDGAHVYLLQQVDRPVVQQYPPTLQPLPQQHPGVVGPPPDRSIFPDL